MDPVFPLDLGALAPSQTGANLPLRAAGSGWERDLDSGPGQAASSGVSARWALAFPAASLRLDFLSAGWVSCEASAHWPGRPFFPFTKSLSFPTGSCRCHHRSFHALGILNTIQRTGQ